MASETGTYTIPSDLLDKIRVFLLAQGFTQDAWAKEAPGNRLHMHKGSFYVHMKSSDDASVVIWHSVYDGATAQIGLVVGTGYDPAKSWRDQPGAPRSGTNAIGVAMELDAGAGVGYALDYDDAYKCLVCYAQKAPGVWRWLAFGESLIKAGSWTGGAWFGASASYFYSSYPSGFGHNSNDAPHVLGSSGDSGSPSAHCLLFVRADVDGNLGWVGTCSGSQTGKFGCTNVNTEPNTNLPSIMELVKRSRNSLNSLSVLLPVQIYAVRTAGGVSLLGTLPNIFAANITGMTPGQSYTQGGSTFAPYPGHLANLGTVIRRV